MLFKDLFMNFCILATFSFFGSMLLNYLNAHFKTSTYIKRQWIGLFFGCLGATLMQFTFPVGDNVLLDLRQISIVLSISMGGSVAGIITTIMIMITRIILSPTIGLSAILGLINAATLCIVASWIFSRSMTFYKKWLYSGIALTIIATASLCIVLGRNEIDKVLVFIVVESAATLFIFMLTRSLRKNNELFEKVSKEAQFDFLTGLHNPRAFEKKFEQLQHQETDMAHSLLFIDIDHFKKVNDVYGHPAGDAVLFQLANVIQQSIRSTDYGARKGGEEFAVWLEYCQLTEAKMIAETLRINVEKKKFILPNGKMIHITISIGIGMYPALMWDELLEKTDQALYQAKQQGRNRSCLAQSSL